MLNGVKTFLWTNLGENNFLPHHQKILSCSFVHAYRLTPTFASSQYNVIAHRHPSYLHILEDLIPFYLQGFNKAMEF